MAHKTPILDRMELFAYSDGPVAQYPITELAFFDGKLAVEPDQFSDLKVRELNAIVIGMTGQTGPDTASLIGREISSTYDLRSRGMKKIGASNPRNIMPAGLASGLFRIQEVADLEYDGLLYRDLSTLKLIAGGLAGRGLSDALGLKLGSTNNLKVSIFRKMGVHSDEEAVFSGYMSGLLPVTETELEAMQAEEETKKVKERRLPSRYQREPRYDTDEFLEWLADREAEPKIYDNPAFI